MQRNILSQQNDDYIVSTNFCFYQSYAVRIFFFKVFIIYNLYIIFFSASISGCKGFKSLSFRFDSSTHLLSFVFVERLYNSCSRIFLESYAIFVLNVSFCFEYLRTLYPISFRRGLNGF